MEAMLAHLGAMLGYVGPAGRHLGATWRQDEAQERQDEPRWRTGAPRRGKIGELRRRGLLQGGSNPCGRTEGAPLHPPKNGFSRMGLQTPTPHPDSNWNWIWKSGRLEDWKTGGLDTGPCVDIVHATVPAARWRIYIHTEYSLAKAESSLARPESSLARAESSLG